MANHDIWADNQLEVGDWADEVDYDLGLKQRVPQSPLVEKEEKSFDIPSSSSKSSETRNQVQKSFRDEQRQSHNRRNQRNHRQPRNHEPRDETESSSSGQQKYRSRKRSNQRKQSDSEDLSIQIQINVGGNEQRRVQAVPAVSERLANERDNNRRQSSSRGEERNSNEDVSKKQPTRRISTGIKEQGASNRLFRGALQAAIQQEPKK